MENEREKKPKESPSVCQFTLPWNADCVEVVSTSLHPKKSLLAHHETPTAAEEANQAAPCSNTELLQGIIAVGMYEFCTSTRKRMGGIQFYYAFQCPPCSRHDLVDGSIEKEKICVVLQEGLHEQDYGVLDMRWMMHEDAASMVLVCVCSDMALRFFKLGVQPNAALNKYANCQHLHKLPIGGQATTSSDTIGIALDVLECSGKAKIAYCCSNGVAGIVEDYNEACSEWQAHTLSPWTIAFDPYQNGNVIATGADDCFLKIWDTRINPCEPIYENKKEHTMGVTVVKYSSSAENTFFTGSYDAYVRIWDTRHLKASIDSFRTSGGIWRIKSHVDCKDKLFIAACDGGCEIWAKGDEGYVLEATHKEHESMAYGITIIKHSELPICSLYKECYLQNNCESFISEKEYLCMSCSFYDRKLNFWLY